MLFMQCHKKYTFIILIVINKPKHTMHLAFELQGSNNWRNSAKKRFKYWFGSDLLFYVHLYWNPCYNWFDFKSCFYYFLNLFYIIFLFTCMIHSFSYHAIWIAFKSIPKKYPMGNFLQQYEKHTGHLCISATIFCIMRFSYYFRKLPKSNVLRHCFECNVT